MEGVGNLIRKQKAEKGKSEDDIQLCFREYWKVKNVRLTGVIWYENITSYPLFYSQTRSRRNVYNFSKQLMKSGHEQRVLDYEILWRNGCEKELT